MTSASPPPTPPPDGPAAPGPEQVQEWLRLAEAASKSDWESDENWEFSFAARTAVPALAHALAASREEAARLRGERDATKNLADRMTVGIVKLIVACPCDESSPCARCVDAAGILERRN